jgi:hypothetical protein
VAKKSKSTKRSTAECVYCGVVGPITEDHIPPKSLFPQPRPSNLITVPACDQCNGSYSKDDEWFRLTLSIRENVKANADRNAVLPSVKRSLERPSAAGFSRAFLENVHEAPRFSPAGLYAGMQRIHVADGARLDRVATRITKGLFYHVKGYRLPDDHGVKAVHYSRLGEPMVNGTEFEKTLLQFVAMLRQETAVKIGETFSYRWLQSPNGPERTIWLLSFYGHDEYFCTTAPLDEVAPA